jgi:hypothetical protein
MYSPYKPTKTICEYHNNIISQSKELQHMKENDFESIGDVINFVINKADDIENDAQFALQAGQNMEDRLIEYKSSIESLGFTRNK